jgi:hypothetical protein
MTKVLTLTVLTLGTMTLTLATPAVGQAHGIRRSCYVPACYCGWEAPVYECGWGYYVPRYTYGGYYVTDYGYGPGRGWYGHRYRYGRGWGSAGVGAFVPRMGSFGSFPRMSSFGGIRVR